MRRQYSKEKADSMPEVGSRVSIIHSGLGEPIEGVIKLYDHDWVYGTDYGRVLVDVENTRGQHKGNDYLNEGHPNWFFNIYDDDFEIKKL